MTIEATKTKRPRQHPEQDLQRVIAGWMRLCIPPEVFWTAINPIPQKTKAQRGASWAMGMQAGVQDFIVQHGLPIAMEAKAQRGTPSPDQRKMKVKWEAGGGVWYFVRSLDEVIAVLEKHGVPHRDAGVRWRGRPAQDAA